MVNSMSSGCAQSARARGLVDKREGWLSVGCVGAFGTGEMECARHDGLVWDVADERGVALQVYSIRGLRLEQTGVREKGREKESFVTVHGVDMV